MGQSRCPTPTFHYSNTPSLPSPPSAFGLTCRHAVVTTCRSMTEQAKPRYRRVLLKLSGEALGGESGVGICPESIHDMARQIGEVRQLGVEIVIVVVGGNLFP